MGTRQRRFLKADRNAGLVATVSILALMVDPCRLFAFAQKGSRPQAIRVS